MQRLVEIGGTQMAVKDKISGKLKEVVMPRGPKSIAEPEKELRFTRKRQAGVFFALAVIAFSLSMGWYMLVTEDWGMEKPLLEGWLWVSGLGLLAFFAFLRLGVRCTRHAYLILSPLGVEIFPFFKARENLQVIYWSQVADAEVEDGELRLHFTEEKKSGVIVSLAPISKARRVFLKKAITGVMKNRNLGVD